MGEVDKPAPAPEAPKGEEPCEYCAVCRKDHPDVNACCWCKRLFDKPKAPKVWDECSKGWHEWSYGKCLRCGKDILPKPAPAPEAKGSEDVEAEITVRVTENGKVQSVAAWERRAVMPVQAQGVRYAQYVPKTAYLALRAELASARDEIAAIKAQAEDATEYVLAVDNRELRKEIEGLRIRVGEYEDMTEINKRFSEIEAELAQAREERDQYAGKLVQQVAKTATERAAREKAEAVIVEYYEAGETVKNGALDRGMTRDNDYARVNAANTAFRDMACAILAARAKEESK